MQQHIHATATSHKSRTHNITSFKDRDDWIKAIVAVDCEEISPTAKIVAIRIALHHNVESGQCNPSLPAVALGTGMSERNVRRMLNELEEAGWLIVHKSRGGRCSLDIYNSHTFELSVPLTRTRLSALNPDTVVRDKEPNPDKPGRLTRTNRVANPDTVVRQENCEITAKRTAKIESPPPDLGDQDSGRRQSDDAADFERFWNAYPKKVDKADARRAYLSVIRKKLATPEQMIAAAQHYAVEQSGNARRYIKNPATWLNKGSYANDPDPGSTSGPTQHRPSGAPDHIGIGMEIARQIMAEEAQNGQ